MAPNHNVTEKSQHVSTPRLAARLCTRRLRGTTRSLSSVGYKDALGLKCMTALFALFKEQILLPSVFALQRASSKHASGSQTRVCVHAQLYMQHFSALSGFTQRLMTPSVFVPTENFPDSYTFGSGMSLLGSFSAISSIMLSQQLQCHCSKQVTPSLKPMGRGKTKPWRQSHRVWIKTGSTKARLTEQHSSTELIIKAVFFLL